MSVPCDAKSVADLITEIQAESAHKRRWRWVEHEGRKLNLAELHVRTRIPHSTLTWRYRRGMRGAELIAPPDPKRTRKADRKVA